MGSTIELDFEQIKNLVKQCDTKEKINLVQELEKETFQIRLRQLLENLRLVDLSFEEITDEVEIVRQRRYAQSSA
ncbi:MAG: hypothetical protein IID16_10815 [Candidatus Marinimicrobia bacterium]|nr:hypothetical protein [Candidatus Neomarinimicrobiota bacterium]